MPTLVEWMGEGVKIALETSEEQAGGRVDVAAGERAAEFYEGSARALRWLQPAEAQAAGVDVEKVAANYMLQAAIGYSSGGDRDLFRPAANALVQVTFVDR